MSAFGTGWLDRPESPLDTSSSASRQHYIDTGVYLTESEVEEFATPEATESSPGEFSFPVEDGTARVTGWADWSGREYTTIEVTKGDGSTYTSVRLSAHVEQARQRWEEARDD